MWQTILIAASTALGVTFVFFGLRYRVTGLDYNSALWRVTYVAAAMATVFFAVTAGLVDAWWLMPVPFYLILFFQAAEGVKRSRQAELEARVNRVLAQSPGSRPSLAALLSEPKVVDYSTFVLYGFEVRHLRSDNGHCDIPVQAPFAPRETTLADLIEIANTHECLNVAVQQQAA
jgi:hypothetical protein